MSELEMEIGRTLGASCFFIYQTIKHNPGATSIDIEMETGLSKYCVLGNLKKLVETGVLNETLKPGHSRLKAYRENQKETWKFH